MRFYLKFNSLNTGDNRFSDFEIDMLQSMWLTKLSMMAGTDSEVVIIDNSEASVWPEKHEEIFIELMEEEVVKGNRNTTTFTKQSWKRIKEELCAQAKRSYTDKQLRNKYNLLRQKHKDFKSLLKETGIGFSVETGQVTAPDELWDRLIRVNKSAKKFRKKGCKNLSLFPSLFLKSLFHRSPQQPPNCDGCPTPMTHPVCSDR
ncbi:hypothetical protein G4B88_001721 [Cannabis sativa]|uniref:Myb/SANT-like domain-containing protein n=1 Tax=Cannabis sativa TaxID=3483 RepID=A0A7J6I1S9_CANSA|nr:hypothetical protein G4B88_001721 [Cannabis sativa]